ncbi:MAG: ATP-binding protein [Propionibacteriaceae bacterium]|nr:ATP-binding protein [Propionibacteriaceae bacterium]
MNSLGFVVDTHLLRELGDLLVGRDSTAIVELVKNGYDADATTVRIHAEHLDDPEGAVVTVEDDGNGMTADRFRSAFLRIAGRDKEDGLRVSPRFHRAYTGQKGIGRLASQKIARILEVASYPRSGLFADARVGVTSRIDWEEIDKQDRLDQLTAGLTVLEVPVTESVPPGTTLTMKSLKRRWMPSDIAKFINELQSAQPPELLLRASADALSIVGESLLGAPTVRDVPPHLKEDSESNRDPGFSVRLSGDLAAGDDLWRRATEDFRWCVEVDVSRGKIRYRISPTLACVRVEPLAKPYDFEATTDPSLRFQARFFMMPNASAQRGPLKGFVRATSGIRVYLEGFRVLPYAEYGDDWLEIDRDYRSGPRFYSIELDESASDPLEVDPREALNAVSSRGYFGAVFLTTRGAPGLQSLVNREGFVPGPTFSAIRQIVQDGVRLSVRVRRSIDNQRSQLKALSVGDDLLQSNEPGIEVEEHRYSSLAGDSTKRIEFDTIAFHGPSTEAQQAIAAAAVAAQEIGKDESGGPGGSFGSTSVIQVLDGFNAANRALVALQSVQTELRTLAGVGLQLGAFVHDINEMLDGVTSVRNLVREMLDRAVDPNQRAFLRATSQAADELAHTLARQSSYLTDVLTADSRHRRSRVRIPERVDSVLRYLAPRIAGKAVSVSVNLPPDLRTVPMFPAEVMILLTNLLTNAVKNAADNGHIWIDGVDSDETIALTISNDGAVVDLDEAERWFLPFESTTTSVDEVLGQGMGLGLPIVRALVDDYNGSVGFVPPVRGVGTAVNVSLPKKGDRR